MNYRLIFTKQFIENLKGFELKLRKRIVAKLEFFAKLEDPLAFAVKIKVRDNLYRFRVGDYRVLFALDADGEIVLLVCLKINHRSKIYR